MKYFTLLKANMKRRKGNFIGILILIFIITISLCTVLSVWKNAHSYETKQLERTGFGDITGWLMNISDPQKLRDQLLTIEEISEVNIQPIIYVTAYRVNGHDAWSIGQLTVYDAGRYHIYQDSLTGLETHPDMPKEHEIYVSPAFVSLYDAQIGDTVEVQVTGEQNIMSFTIKGFLEDPVSGASTMGMKTMLIHEAAFQNLWDQITASGQAAQSLSACGALFHIFRSPDCSLSSGELQGLIHDRTTLNQYTVFTFSKNSIINIMLLLQNVFSAFLLIFTIILLTITIIVIGHSINSSLEQDYVDIGILKAVGFTEKNLQILQLLQYMTTIIAGMLLGIPVSVLIIRLINRMTVTATGLILPEILPARYCAGVLGCMLLLLAGFICIRVSKIEKITPIRAIRGGTDDIYFKSRFTTPIHQKGLNFYLALRQLISGKKQYISACLITMLLVFFLSLTGRIDAWLGPDGEGLMDSFAGIPYDLAVKWDDDELQSQGEARILSYTEIKNQYEYRVVYTQLNHMNYLMNITSKPEYYNVLEGRTCKYPNELLITDLVRKELGIDIGDTVTVSYEGQDLEFIITGIYQCSNEMGANFGITRKGFQLFETADQEQFYTRYQFEDPSLEKTIYQMLNDTYGDQIELEENTWSGIESIVLAMSALEGLMLTITVIFILITVYMTGSKILYREQHDIGIYKSLGFTSARLRFAFALRFGMVAAAGSLLGILLSAYVTDPLATLFLRQFGIGSFTSYLHLFPMILPGIIVTGLFLIFAYCAAGKIKRTQPNILIVE